MLINATQPEELRVAMIDGQSIYDFDLEQQGQERKRSNIYKAKVSRVEQSLGAAFVDFGSDKHGFLPMKELASTYLKGKTTGKASINDCLTQGQELIVQVDKEERGTKGAALTTLISLPGHYLVLMPNSPEARGLSRNLEGKEREKVKENYNALEFPETMGVIARTAAKGATLEELKWDLDYLLSIWEAIQEADQLREPPFLIYRDDDLISRSLRDFLREDITEVLVDSKEAYEKASEFASRLAPELQDRIKRYNEIIPLFTRYQVETQIETAYQRKVDLNNGGSIVIDQTEALVSIDINSAKATGGSNIEETALKTNLEAAKEIAKQLRLRDIGGLIVIDFIDMGSLKNKRAIEDMVHKSISIDRAKIQVGNISRFGLLEMSRQRLRPSLQERWTQDIGSLSTSVLRLIEEESGKKKNGEVRAVVSSDMSVFLLNERRSRIGEIEERSKVKIVVVSDPNRSDNRFEVHRLKSKNKKAEETSYNIKEEKEKSGKEDGFLKNNKIETAAVDISPKNRPKRKGPSFLSKILKGIGHKSNLEKESEKESTKKTYLKHKTHQRRKNQKNYQREKANLTKDKNSKGDKKTKQKASNKNLISEGDNKSSKPNHQKGGVKKSPNALPKIKKTLDPLPKKVKTKEKKGQEIGNIKPTANKEKLEGKGNQSVEEKESIPEVKKPSKTAKEWGMASNDPRSKAK